MLFSATLLFFAILALYVVLEHHDAAPKVRAAINKIFHIDYLFEVTEFIDTHVEFGAARGYPHELHEMDWSQIAGTPEYRVTWGRSPFDDY